MRCWAGTTPSSAGSSRHNETSSAAIANMASRLTTPPAIEQSFKEISSAWMPPELSQFRMSSAESAFGTARWERLSAEQMPAHGMSSPEMLWRFTELLEYFRRSDPRKFHRHRRQWQQRGA